MTTSADAAPPRKDGSMFTVHTDRPLLPVEPSERLLRVALHVPRPEGEAARKPVHLSLVIDRSGSMAGEKLRLAVHAAREAIRSLQDVDRFSVVTFDQDIDVPVPSTQATPRARLAAETALDAVISGGNTHLSGGWLRGCSEVGAHLPEDAIGRALLLTDGEANCGITSPDELTRLAREHRMRRVTTSTIGLGDGFNEHLLGRLSEEGGGNFYFAEREGQLPGFVARELGDVLSVVARDASLVIHAPEGVDVESLNDYPCTRDGTTFSFSLGSLSGGMALAPMFRLRFPGGPAGQQHSATVRLDDRDGALPKEPRIQTWIRVSTEQAGAQIVDTEVIRPAAALDAARTRRVALELNRAGQRKESAARLAEVAAHVRGYAAGDPESLAQADRLDAEKDDYAREMSAMGMKGRHFRAMMAMKMGLVAEPDSQVLAVATSARQAPLLQTATRALAGVKGAPTWAVASSILRTSSSPGALSIGDEADLVEEAFPLGFPYGPEVIQVVFVEPPLVDGWFSHWHERGRVAVVSLAGVEQLVSSPVASFIAYELVLHGLRAIRPGYDPASVLHPETRACLFDLCPHKADVAIKLQAGHICAPCLQKLAALGFDRDAVVQVWRAVQTLAQTAPSPPVR